MRTGTPGFIIGNIYIWCRLVERFFLCYLHLSKMRTNSIFPLVFFWKHNMSRETKKSCMNLNIEWASALLHICIVFSHRILYVIIKYENEWNYTRALETGECIKIYFKMTLQVPWLTWNAFVNNFHRPYSKLFRGPLICYDDYDEMRY